MVSVRLCQKDWSNPVSQSVSVSQEHINKFLLQVLSTETIGKVSDFQAVPGCGLKCNVTNIEPMMNPDTTDVEIMNRRNSTTSSKSFHVIIDGVDGETQQVLSDVIGMTTLAFL